MKMSLQDQLLLTLVRLRLALEEIWPIEIRRATSTLSEIHPKGGKGGFDVSMNGLTCTPVSCITFLFRSV